MNLSLRLDHILTFTDTDAVDAQLATYRRAGFLPHDHTARWNPGLRNGFVRFWPEYLEFLWVEDEDAFAVGGARYHTLGGPDCHTVRRAGRPYGVGFYADDVATLHKSWCTRGFKLPEVAYWRLKDTLDDAPPDFAYQEIPHVVLPGVNCFALTLFYPNPVMRRQAWVSPNSAFAISGLTFVCDDPAVHGAAWRNFLAPESALAEVDGGSELRFGPHHFTWLTPDAYGRRYAQPWLPAPHPHGELAIVQLLAEDLALFETSLAKAGWRVARSGDETLEVAASAATGVSFLVRESSAERWLAERKALTGERLELHREVGA